MSFAPILLTGAAGKTGRAILAALHRRGAAVRAWVRRPEQVDEMLALGAEEVMVGDLLDERVARQALHGIRAVHHICPNMHPDEVRIGKIMLTAAQRAGVRHFVYHSVLHPQTESMPHHWNKLRVEEMLFESGMPYAILQPTAYMQNLLAYRRQILEETRFALPYRPEARISLVDLVDVAEAAARVLTEPGHEYATYELVGTPPLSQIEVAKALSAHLGRPIRVEQTPIAVWREQAARAGLSEYAIETLSKMFRYYDAFGLEGNPRVLTWLLQRKPTALHEWIARVFS
ncbi:MAG: NmrA family NAD(P)-binding protein [Chloroflexi bacterium]|nr:NmrA family NAD(P)-binding protein [Chloroflexota bacterium]